MTAGQANSILLWFTLWITPCVCVCVCVCVKDFVVTTMSGKWGSTRSRPGAFPGLSEPPRGQGIHVYLFWTKEGERYLSHTSGEVTAEELCISAAEAVGESDSPDPIHPHTLESKQFVWISLFLFEVFWPAVGTCA